MKNWVFIILIGIFASCNSEESVHNSVSELSEKMNFLGNPTSVQWTENDYNSVRGGPNEFYLHAVISYKSRDYQRVKSRFINSKMINSRIYLDKEKVPDWFVEAAKNEMYEEGDFLRIKQSAFDPTPFLKNSYKGGFVFFMDKKKKLAIFLSTI